MRIYALYILVASLACYAWKDWFMSLCALILMMAVMQHEDMPKTIMGIQGFNMWNLLFVSIVLAWVSHRRLEGLRWDMPAAINVLLLLYLTMILFGFVRSIYDRSNLDPLEYSTKSMISDELVNTIKWVLPGLLLFDGCRSRSRIKWALTSILLMYFLLAVQVVKRMPWSAALSAGEELSQRGLRVCEDIGYSRCDMSTFLAGASWAMVAVLPLIRLKKYKFLPLQHLKLI